MASGRERLAGVEAGVVDPHDLARAHVAHLLGADEVERAGLGGDDPVVADPPERERADPMRVAERNERVLCHRDHRVGALEALHRGGNGLRERRGIAREQRCDDLGVGARDELDPVGDQLLSERGELDEVAVVPEGDGSRRALMDERLRVLPVGATGGRVPRVPDRDIAGECRELLLVEHLRHEPHLAKRGDAPSFRDRDPGRLLTTMLEGEQAEVREPGNVTLVRAHAEDAAHL